MILVAAIVGVGAYAIYFNNRHEATPASKYSQKDLTICLDGQKTIIITKNKGYRLGGGSKDTSDELNLTIANYFLAQKKGNFRVLEGPAAGQHHLDKGRCH